MGRDVPSSLNQQTCMLLSVGSFSTHAAGPAAWPLPALLADGLAACGMDGSVQLACLRRELVFLPRVGFSFPCI